MIRPTSHRWAASLPPLVLHTNSVQVWCVCLDSPPLPMSALEDTLDRSEYARASNFHFQRHRLRYVAARGLLRMLLGRYLNVDPSAVLIQYGPFGKPALAQDEGCIQHLSFNLAHSDGVALIAVTRNRDVGVDVERVRPLRNLERLAERVLSGRERAWLAALDDADRVHAFYRCWTRKEAFLKALGHGLTRPLDRFEVSMWSREPARLVRIEWAPEEIGRWSIAQLEPVAGYGAALAVSGAGDNVHCHSWV